MSDSKDSQLLGQSFDKATRKLRNLVLLNLLVLSGRNSCFRCHELMTENRPPTIDHEEAWRSAEDPISRFFDLENIQFSHLGCNSRASDRTAAIAVKHSITHCPHGHEY